ncbi:VOC family protein [Methylobacterium sp. J-090]|uniref:VOC family protein n=1 Tax=Methylobacterium sp. J-090 TaxID=2836666 RepID=UPI001FB93312|nr:VOC family protein [Methylobacterium sp. J-090]MCJ2083586.1 VOC family protein [Methylobacterium sp. J-090]
MDGLVAISRTVADLARTEAFYEALDFRRLGPVERIPGAMLEALGLPDASGGRLRMGLGRQSIEFLAFDVPGQRYPVGASASDPWFQHAAIVVSDMDRAFARLEGFAPVPISRGGPQLLPPSSGGVTAWKFRDPDGHPLELIAFPEGGAGRHWAKAPGVFAGIDHSAITVTDVAAAVAFFRDGLGLRLLTRGLNTGPGQAALDGLPDPTVDVIALAPSGVQTPHVELLRYRAPPAPAAPLPLTARDRATSRLCFGVDDLAALLAHLAEVRPEHTVIRSDDGRMAGLTGPDGHGILLMTRQDADGRAVAPA